MGPGSLGVDQLVETAVMLNDSDAYNALADRLVVLIRISQEAYPNDQAAYDDGVDRIQEIGRAFEKLAGSAAGDLLRKLAHIVSRYPASECGTADALRLLEMHWQGIGGWL